MLRKLKKALFILIGTVLVLAILAGAALFAVTRDYSGAAPVSVAECTNPYISKTGSPMISAHRSGAGIAPENTMLAFENIVRSADFSIDIFEFDLHLTKDGQLILLHDGTLDRTSDAVEVFGHEGVHPLDYTYEELRLLNMGEGFVTDSGETPYKGLRGDAIPDNLRVVRLEDVFDYLQEFSDFRFIIEIKDSEDTGRRATDELYRILTERDMLERAVVGTFHGEITAYMDEAHPDMLRSASVMEVAGFYFDSLLGIPRADSAYKFVALQIPDEDYIVKLGTTRMVNYAHKHNIAVQYWTINDEAHARELASKGADAILSDYPDMVYRLLGSPQD